MKTATFFIAVLPFLTLVHGRVPIEQLIWDEVGSLNDLWTAVKYNNATTEGIFRGTTTWLNIINRVTDPLANSPQELVNITRWRDAQQLATEIDGQFQNMRRFLPLINPAKPDEKAWKALSEKIFDSIPLLGQFHKMSSALYFEAFQQREASDGCAQGQSAKTLLYNMYTSIQLSLLKSFATIQAAWIVKQSLTKANLTQESTALSSMYNSFVNDQAEAVTIASQDATDTIWRCDPQLYKSDVTHTSFKGLLQGYVINEVDMDSQKSCRRDCKDFQSATRLGCHENRCPAQLPCSGRIFNCKFYDADMRICMNPEETQRKTSRRYEYVLYENGTTLGTGKPCETVKIDSWWRKIPPSHCTYCFCQCEDSEDVADRYISLGSAVADVEKNMVVTGLSLIKLPDRVLYLQVQQGVLQPYGGVDPSTLEWKTVDLKAPKKLLTYEERKLDLGDIHLDHGRAVTGVRFEEIDGRLRLNVKSAPIQFNEGKVDPKHNEWLARGSSQPQTTRHPLQLKSTSVVLGAEKSKPYPEEETQGSYVEFGPSSYEADAAQTTIPLIELQPVVTDPPCLLSGAGIYHKGSNSSAGFVAPRIFTYNYRHHIRSPVLPDRVGRWEKP